MSFLFFKKAKMLTETTVIPNPNNVEFSENKRKVFVMSLEGSPFKIFEFCVVDSQSLFGRFFFAKVRIFSNNGSDLEKFCAISYI